VTQDTSPEGIYFKSDGRKMYISGNQNNSIYEYTLTAPWDVSTSILNFTLAIVTIDNNIQNIFFRQDGVNMYFVGRENNSIYEFNLSDPWDLSTATLTDTFISNLTTTPTGLYIKPNSTKLYLSESEATPQIFEYNVGINVEGNSNFDTVTLDSVKASDAFVFSNNTTQSRAAIPDSNHGFLETAILNDSLDIEALTTDTDPRGITFSADGRKMYVLGVSTGRIYEIDLLAPYQITGASLLQSLPVSGIDTSPRALHLKEDGKILFMTGVQNISIYRFDLSTANDITTAVVTQTLIVSGQDTVPSSITVTSDGNQLYMSGVTNDRIYRYDLPSPYTITGASFINFFPVAGDDSNSQGIAISPDATKIYLVGETNDVLLQYRLETPKDITTAVLENTLDISDQDNIPLGLFVSPDLTSFFFTGRTNASVYKYNFGIKVEGNSTFDRITGNSATMRDTYLFSDTSTQEQAATPDQLTGDVSTTIHLQHKVVSAQDDSPQDVFIRSDGKKMYVVGTENGRIYEYDLSIAYDVLSASFLQFLLITGQDTFPTGIFFRSDGTKMYISGLTNTRIYEYDLSTAWDITTATTTLLQFFPVGAQDTSPQNISFRPDGKKMYMTGAVNSRIFEYDLSTPWDITTAVILQSLLVISEESLPRASFFRSDGTKMYVVGNTNDTVFEYNLSTPWDVTTAAISQSFSVALQDTFPTGVFFSSNNRKMFISGTDSESVHEYDLGIKTDGDSIFDFITTRVTTALDSFIFSDNSTQEEAGLPDGISGFMNTAILNQSKNISSDTELTGIFFRPDGTKMYVIENANLIEGVDEFDLSIPWDITTAVFSQTLLTNPDDNQPRDLFFRHDGLKMYILGSQNDKVYEYDLTTAWDVSTASLVESFILTTQTGSPSGLSFRPDGTKMYITGFTGEPIFEYNLAAPWDVSTASIFQTATLLVSGSFRTIDFRADGKKMYMITVTPDQIVEYNLSIPWDVSTLLFLQTRSFAGEIADPRGIFLRSDSKKMYITDDNIEEVFEYDLGIKVDGKVIVGTGSSDASAIVDIISTTKGFLPPRMTGTQRDAISTPATGLEVYNTSTDIPSFFDSTTWRPLADPTNVISITTQSDWDDLVSSNTITITESTTILIKTFIATPANIVVNSGVNFSLLGQDIANAGILYVGGGTFITSDGFDVIRIFGIGFLSGNGSGTLFNITNGGTFFRLQNNGIFNWDGLGTVSDSAVFEILNTGVFNTGSKFVLDNVINIALDGANFTNFITDTSDALVQIKSSELLDITATITLTSSLLKPNESYLEIDPAVGDGSTFVVTDNSLAGSNQTLFDDTGTSGLFNVVTDATVAATAITSVTDSAGIARFNFTVGPTVFVNQKIVNSGFATSDYNGTFAITATGAGFFEVASIAFDIDETGSFLSDSVILVSGGHGLSNGATLVVDTDFVTDYDGGTIIYNVQSGSFQINRAFVATASGTWDTTPINERDVRIDAQQNGRTADAMVESEADFLDVTGTEVTINTVLVAEKIGVTTWVSTHTQRSTISTAGVMTYNGRTDKDILVNFSASVERVTGTPTNGIGIGLFKNGALISGFVYKRSFNAGIVELNGTRTVDMVTGDTMELVVINFDNAVNINVYQANVIWNQTA